MSKQRVYQVGDAVGIKDAPQGAVLGHVVEVLHDGRYTRYRIQGTDGREYVRASKRLNDCRPEHLAHLAALKEKRAAIFRANREAKLARTTVPAKDISDFGGFFKKPGGSYVHMRMSESSVKYLKLDESKVYGVSYSGNVSVLSPDARVVPCTVQDLVGNHEENQRWEDAVGVTAARQYEREHP